MRLEPSVLCKAPRGHGSPVSWALLPYLSRENRSLCPRCRHSLLRGSDLLALYLRQCGSGLGQKAMLPEWAEGLSEHGDMGAT
jgi:hypothetical protein